MINIRIPVSDYCRILLYVQVPVTLNYYSTSHGIFKAEKNEPTVAIYGLSTIKCRDRTAHMAYPPYSEHSRRERQQILNRSSPLAAIRLPFPPSKTRRQWVMVGNCNWRNIIVEFNDYMTLIGCFMSFLFKCELTQIFNQPVTWHHKCI